MKKTAKTSLMGTASLAVAVAFGTGFHLAYPAVPIDTGLAMLFFLAGAVTWAIAFPASRLALRHRGGGFKKVRGEPRRREKSSDRDQSTKNAEERLAPVSPGPSGA